MLIGLIKGNLRVRYNIFTAGRKPYILLPFHALATFGILIGLLCFSSFVIVKQAHAEPTYVCVICNDPHKVYQCTYNAPPATSGLINLQGLQFACIQEVAEYGKHEQCAANRKTVTECKGTLYSLKHSPVRIPADQVGETAPPVEPAHNPSEQNPTLVDSTKKTFNQTKGSVEKSYETTKDTVKKGYKTTTSTISKTVKSVGSSISDAASTTYNCITSLFSKCSE